LLPSFTVAALTAAAAGAVVGGGGFFVGVPPTPPAVMDDPPLPVLPDVALDRVAEEPKPVLEGGILGTVGTRNCGLLCPAAAPPCCGCWARASCSKRVAKLRREVDRGTPPPAIVAKAGGGRGACFVPVMAASRAELLPLLCAPPPTVALPRASVPNAEGRKDDDAVEWLLPPPLPERPLPARKVGATTGNRCFWAGAG
jgi:hypothetical protein